MNPNIIASIPPITPTYINRENRNEIIPNISESTGIVELPLGLSTAGAAAGTAAGAGVGAAAAGAAETGAET